MNSEWARSEFMNFTFLSIGNRYYFDDMGKYISINTNYEI